MRQPRRNISEKKEDKRMTTFSGWAVMDKPVTEYRKG